MKVRKPVLQKIKENVRLKNLIALALNRSVFTVTRLIEDEHDDLTKAAALKVIREELGLTDEQILEEDVHSIAGQ